MVEELTLTLPGLRMAAQAWGPVNGKPVLALHGWLDNAASFAPMGPLLPGLRLVALDLAGHGHSGWRPPGCRYHFVDNVYDVLAAADALGWHRFAVLGHSLGAAVACLVAASAPQRIQRLALIEGLGPLTEPAEVLGERLRQAVAAERRLADKSLPVHADVQAAANVRQRVTGLEHHAALRLAERGTREVEGGVTWRSDPRLTLPSPFYLGEEQVQTLLASIAAPTLLIRAHHGFLQKRPELAARLRCVAGLRDVEMPGRHHLHMEQPDRVAPLLAEFLEGTDGD